MVERAELFVEKPDIDYEKRPKRALKEDEPRVLESSKKFRAALLAKFRGEKVEGDSSRFGVLTEKEFVFVVEQSLRRKMEDLEITVLLQAYRRLFPIDAAFVEQALTKAVTMRGERMHIGYYAKIMEETKQNRR